LVAAPFLLTKRLSSTRRNMWTRSNSYCIISFHASAGHPNDPQPATPPKVIQVSNIIFPLKFWTIRSGVLVLVYTPSPSQKGLA
jgi:hypothetical protein